MKNLILPLAAVALVSACAPYPPFYPNQNPTPAPAPTGQQALTAEQQRQIQENRERLEREKRQRELDRANNNNNTVTKPPVKPKYPTAAAVPGKPGFVFNPYTHNIVDVKGIGSGKLVRDPEDNDATHKFRVP